MIFPCFERLITQCFVRELYFETLCERTLWHERSQCLLKLADMDEYIVWAVCVAALVRFSVVLRCWVCLCDVVSKPAVLWWKRVCQAVYDDALRKPVSAADVWPAWHPSDATGQLSASHSTRQTGRCRRWSRSRTSSQCDSRLRCHLWVNGTVFVYLINPLTPTVDICAQL